MRILHLINHCYDGNGHVNVAVDLACTQVAAGHEVTVASTGGPYVELLETNGVDHVNLLTRQTRGALFRRMWALLRLVRRRRPDVIHAHMMTSAALGFIAGRFCRRPLITTMHNSFDWHSGVMRLGQIIVAVSDAERQLLLSRGYPARRVFTVPNGVIGTPRDAWRGDGIGRVESPSIMTLSGLHPRKGIGDAIDAFALLHADFPDWHLNIVGDGPDRTHLERRVDGLGLQDKIHLLGATPRPSVLLEQAQIFVSAALAEPFGLSVAEARAAGCAVVGTSVGGIPQVLGYGEHGQLVPPGDPTALAAALRSLMSDPENLRSWQAKARQQVEFFSVQRMSADYIHLYQILVGKRSGSIGRPNPRWRLNRAS